MKISTTYQAGFECNADAQIVRGLLLPWLLMFEAIREVTEHDGQDIAFGDVTVIFSLVEGAPTYGELLWLIDALVDCHVAAQTLALRIDYTGERSEHRPFQAPAVMPDSHTRYIAMKALLAYLDTQDLSVERARESFRVLGAAGTHGAGWEAWANEHFTKGAVFVATHEKTGLTAVRSVSAELGDKHWERHLDARAKKRMKLLSL